VAEVQHSAGKISYAIMVSVLSDEVVMMGFQWVSCKRLPKELKNGRIMKK
jgi:hypothetical protein